MIHVIISATIAAPHSYASNLQVLYNDTVRCNGETYTGIGLKWTTTQRPLGMKWSVNGSIEYKTLDVLRDRANATYDHILIVPSERFNQSNMYTIQLQCTAPNISTPQIHLIPSTYTCYTISHSSCMYANPIDLQTVYAHAVPPIPSNVIYNSSSSMLSWTVNSSKGVSFIEKYLIEYTPSGSQCNSTSSLHTEEVHSNNITVEGVARDIFRVQLEHNVNYTISIMSSNFRYSSSWSSVFNISLPSKGTT